MNNPIGEILILILFSIFLKAASAPITPSKINQRISGSVTAGGQFPQQHRPTRGGCREGTEGGKRRENRSL